MKTMETSVSIPDRLRKRPRFRGMPIPYLTLIDSATNVPDFKVNDERLRFMVIRTKRCGLCGEKLMARMAFIGGPKCIEQLLFLDPAMHISCAQYAWDVCPFIVYGKGYAQHSKTHAGVTIETADEIMDTGAPERMALMVTTGYTPAWMGTTLLVRTKKPVSVVWRDYGTKKEQ